MPREDKNTFGEMRESGATKILVHCVCGRAIQMDAGRWPDDMRLSESSRDSPARFAATKALSPTKLRARKNGHLMKYTSPAPLPIQRRPRAASLKSPMRRADSRAHPH
jgi:hypothetical protein